MSFMDLSIIIINWNSVDYLNRCLETIYANTKGINFEVIVVDNASFDGSGEFLATHYPKVKFMQNQKNTGFANANNLGFKHSIGDNILFLNPDTEIAGPAIAQLLHYLKSAINVGAIGCKLLNTDGSIQTTCIKAFPTILYYLLDSDFLLLRFPGWKVWGVRPLFFYRGTPEPVEVVTGACLMVKRTVFESVGMFSSEYFMYGEDVDLCYKLHKFGRTNYYNGGVSIIHHGGKSAEQTNFKQFNTIHKRKSGLIYFKKFHGSFAGILYVLTMGLSSAMRLFLISITCPFIFFKIDRGRVKMICQKWLTILKWSLRLYG